MPGARSIVRPAPASDSSVSDEASQLELHLQRQLEEDVARIFDESLYSDLEVVSGKLKILTHSCILKARTKQFYHKLETILHANIGRNTFEEIYSFISDAYTECNIRYQEKEIIKYLEEHLNAVKSIPNNSLNSKADAEESDIFLTPKCGTPYVEKTFHKSLSASPSTELTKEYYALVPIEENLLDKELIEQDALSNAFKSIIKSQAIDLNTIKLLQRDKPTSLSLSSSHLCKTVKHSNSCDILNNLSKDNSSQHIKRADKLEHVSTSLNLHNNSSLSLADDSDEKHKPIDNKDIDPSFSPDSLIADDPSSSSDYLSAAYTCTPGVSVSGGYALLNVADTITKMENTFTSSDSGLENTGLLESLSSHKDITLTDVSLTESTLHDLTADETIDSVSSSNADKNYILKNKITTQTSLSGTTSSEKDVNIPASNHSPKFKDNFGRKSSKEEKQRQNEEIVILESSSLSSETGSWESVFPPKNADKEICEKFISNEREYSDRRDTGKTPDPSPFTAHTSSLQQSSTLKSTSCFIDAASLVDIEDETIKVQNDSNAIQQNIRNAGLPAPSQPLPCTTAKFDVSPNDCSESNENEDSLEQADNKDTDSEDNKDQANSKDLSPEIFEMTPITEDSLCTNAFEKASHDEERHQQLAEADDKAMYSYEKEPLCTGTILVSGTTPHNSIMTLKVSSLKQYESEESESDTTVVGHDGLVNIKKSVMKYNESSPIVSGGASIEDHLPQIASHSGSPLTRRRIENIPIVSGAYTPQQVDSKQRKSPKPSSAAAWIVDMSHSPISDADRNASSITSSSVKRPGDRTCELLRNGSKSSLDSCHSLDNNRSRSSVDSDGSEKSCHKFYIDLSSLPDPIPPKNKDSDKSCEKKNIFSMYIDLGEKPAKEMPARLSSSMTTRRNAAETKGSSKLQKNCKINTNELCAPDKNKLVDGNSLCTFEKYESLCNDPNINIAEIIEFDEKPSTQSEVTSKEELAHAVTTKCLKLQSDTISGQCQNRNSSVKTEKPVSEQSGDLFVKLSDLDKPLIKSEVPATILEEKILDERMTRSIPENKWDDQKNPGTSRSIEVISSFHSENALSLNRLFPHLKNEFSRSMPGSLSGRTRSPLRMGMSFSPGDIEDQASEASEMSSMQSSMCRSVVENSTTEDTSQTSSLIGNCQSRLGQDLLRMFLQEIAPDVVVEVSGRRIKAHKCILSSRCQYFAGILSGGWVESAGNVIVLPPFSYNVVHFALCHIYSGLSTIPDTISIVELATIADMLGLEGLKEAIMFTLKAKYCHHFHRPCQVCTAGVLECFPLSSVYGLDDLYRKCLRWITKYFTKVWPTKAFATLPKELLDKCYQQQIVNMNIENLVDTVYGCGVTVASLQNSRWADSVARLCRRLVNAAAHHAAPRLLAVMHAMAPLAPDAPPPAKQALEDCLAAAIEWAPPDEACRAYAFLSTLVKEIRSQQYSKPDLISNGSTNKPSAQSSLLYLHACSWRLQCEGALVRAAPRVVGTQAFKDLPPDLRKRLRELGCIMYGAQPFPMTSTPIQDRRTRSSYTPKNKPPNQSVAHSLDIDHVRASFVPYAPKPAVNLGSVEVLKSNNDIRDRRLKGAHPPKIRSTKAQEERARFNLSKNNQSQDRLSNRNSARISYENTKPRYLEHKVTKEADKKAPLGKKMVPKMISSSESSRNSSPIQARNARTSRLKGRAGDEARAPTMSQDSLATGSRPRTAEPSTDSLSESQKSNKYATYTKTKHIKGSVESVNSSKCPNNIHSSTSMKTKTKIPVYLNQVPKFNNGDTKHNTKKRPIQSGNTVPLATAAINQARPSTAVERKVPRSLMSATKSSSAKMVPKVVKETNNKNNIKGKKSTQIKHVELDKPPDIPVMERSGTFLKDEPTFGDKTTNIDIELDH
ncbi:hypothetical protein O0L34_g2591 [Tuta absoluta]|nr:hypothetical protein O0L34_g2591 [Tuta absoluta]